MIDFHSGHLVIPNMDNWQSDFDDVAEVISTWLKDNIKGEYFAINLSSATKFSSFVIENLDSEFTNEGEDISDNMLFVFRELSDSTLFKLTWG